jgi:ribose transport system substrate-binding protein
MKHLAKVGSLIAAALTLAACSSSASGPGGGSSGQSAKSGSVKIGYIGLGDSLDFPRQFHVALEAEATKRNVKLVYCDSGVDVSKALDCAKTMAVQNVSGLLSSAPDPSASPRRCAAQPKVPMVSFGIQEPPCETVYYGPNNLQSGLIAGKEMGQYAKEKWNCAIDAVLILAWPEAGQDTANRTIGELQGLKQGCPSAPSATTVDSKNSTDTTIPLVKDFLQTQPNKHHIVVLSFTDVATVGAAKAAEALNRTDDIYIASQSTSPIELPYLCGTAPFKNLVSDTAFFAKTWATQGMDIILGLLNGKTYPKVVDTPLSLVTPANVRTVISGSCK